MKPVNPRLLLLLLAVIVLVGYVHLSNPHRQYSTEQFWLSASVDDVYQIPEAALAPGNKNGSVLMWAAMATQDPKVIAALVDRGADVNEADIIFTGTPLTSAAASSSNPAIIDELIKLGADIDKQVGSNNKTALIIAAELNPNPEIIDRLIRHGADINYKDLTDRTALEQAIRFQNASVVDSLKQHSNSRPTN